MKLSKMMIAVAALAAASSAFADAANVAYVTGASATKNNQKVALTNMCTAAGGVFSNPAYMNSGSNISTYVCAAAPITNAAGYVAAAGTFVPFDGTPYTEVRLSVANGSYTALLGLAGALTGDDNKFVNPATGAIEFVSSSIGGLMDVEPEAFDPATVINPFTGNLTVDNAGITQTFGVAVSNALYNAMFDKQVKDGILLASCSTTPAAALVSTNTFVPATFTPACTPSISKADMASVMNANTNAAVKLAGASYFGAPANTELKYYRRVDTSGTQAAAQAYFLGLPCSSGALQVIEQPTADNEAGGLKDRLYGTKFRVYAAPGTGDVRGNTGTGLNHSTAYAIGVMSGENNPVTYTVGTPAVTFNTTWKWLRVQEAPLSELATPSSSGVTNIAYAASGRYDFIEESKVVYDADNTDAAAFFPALTTALTTLTQPVGLANTASNMNGYTRNGNACTAVSR